MRGFGGMVPYLYFRRESGFDFFLEKLKVFPLSESPGAVESLANHPALMALASIPEDKRKEIGIKDDLVPLTVGFKDIDD